MIVSGCWINEVSGFSDAEWARLGSLMMNTDNPSQAASGPHLTVDKSVPVPKARRQPRKYPWDSMGVGHSFFVDGGDDVESVQNLVSSAAARVARRGKGRFTTRQVKEGGVVGVRCWRVA